MTEKPQGNPVHDDPAGPHLTLNVDLAYASVHPEAIAASVALAFYRELRRHNFTNNQIINVATELIDCLNKSLEGYKKKTGEGQER